MRKFTEGLVFAALMAGVLTGCASGNDKAGKAGKADTAEAAGKAAGKSESSKSAAPAATASTESGRGSGTRVGEAGSACELPVSFETAEGWTAKAMSAVDSEFLGELTHHKSLKGACELDTKERVISRMLVWTGPATDSSARHVLDVFMTEEGEYLVESKYQDLKVGGLPAVEVVYKLNSPKLKENREQRALALSTPKGVVVVQLRGFDTAEHRQILPVYELAKKTVSGPSVAAN
ncbi:lipoprotein [Streptomyces sp. NPDC021096]|uniref:lipoprotein n=1 Tax=Streptomyces sp. NPDC021096 TaxID=3154792 RepID=UPI00340E544C